MIAPIFVDTNIFITARDPNDAAKQARAAEWIANFWRDRNGRTSVQVLSEYYYNVTHKLTPRIDSADAWDDVQALFEWRPHPIDGALLERARDIEQRWRLNWWDSMIVAAAQAQSCTILLTEDLQDGAMFGGVTVRNPFTHNINEPAATYAVHPVAASRHRGRGRPRKAMTA
jgi:predicted nucleic acid-binding protein